MVILTALQNQLAFIEWFYTTAAQPFFTFFLERMKGPEQQDVTPDDVREKWQKGLNVLGHSSLGLVSKAIQDYLCHFILREVVNKPNELKGKSTFEKYENFLLTKTKFRWEECPIERNRIEQIHLCRNDFIHDPSIDGRQPKQDKRHFEKHPGSRFIASWEQVMVETITVGTGKKPDHQFSLRVTGDELIRVIGDAGRFCEFVDSRRTST